MTALAAIMKERGITTRQLSEDTGIPQRTLEGNRSGRCALSLEAGLKIADALDVDPHDLIKPEP